MITIRQARNNVDLAILKMLTAYQTLVTYEECNDFFSDKDVDLFALALTHPVAIGITDPQPMVKVSEPAVSEIPRGEETLHSNGCTEKAEDFPVNITWTEATEGEKVAVVSAANGDWLLKHGIRKFLKCLWKVDAPADADPEWVVLQSPALGLEHLLTYVPYDAGHKGHQALKFETKRLSL